MVVEALSRPRRVNKGLWVHWPPRPTNETRQILIGLMLLGNFTRINLTNALKLPTENKSLVDNWLSPTTELRRSPSPQYLVKLLEVAVNEGHRWKSKASELEMRVQQLEKMLQEASNG